MGVVPLDSHEMMNMSQVEWFLSLASGTLVSSHCFRIEIWINYTPKFNMELENKSLKISGHVLLETNKFPASKPQTDPKLVEELGGSNVSYHPNAPWDGHIYLHLA